jgi:hypothetical protein
MDSTSCRDPGSDVVRGASASTPLPLGASRSPSLTHTEAEGAYEIS